MSKSSSVSDHRTQVYLPNHLYRVVKEQAQQQQVSMASVIRDAVAQQYQVQQQPQSQVMQYAGYASDKARDVSQNTTKYLQEIYDAKVHS